MIVNDFLIESQVFNMIEGKKMSAMLPKSWKKSFIDGIIKPTKMRQCNNCKDGLLCKTCNNQVTEKKFKALVNDLKRHPPNEFGHMLPLSKIKLSTFCTKSSIIYSCCLHFIIYTLANFFNFSKVYGSTLRSIDRKQTEHLTSPSLNLWKLL